LEGSPWHINTIGYNFKLILRAVYFDGAFFIRRDMRTLVLNAGYEPLGVVSFKRALILVINQKATVLAGSGNQKVHSAKTALDLPSVILLRRYVRVPTARKIPVTRRGVLRRDAWRCAYCQKPANTIDHVQPKSRGGAETWENLVACCLKCNNLKGDKTLAEIGWELSFVPKMPTGAGWLVRGVERIEPEWDSFLELAA
jgi:5-methylcytosine-specific restriction endonuclease McrA